VFSIAAVLTGESKKTVDLTHKHRKPVLHLARDGGPASPHVALLHFIQEHSTKVLNVAGSRASKEPEVSAFVIETLRLAPLGNEPGPIPEAEHPVIKTARSVLRPWRADDAATLQQLAGRREIADTMISVPHPFTHEYAEKWIASHAEAFARGKALHFAITLAGTGSFSRGYRTESRQRGTQARRTELLGRSGVVGKGYGHRSRLGRCAPRIRAA
jgi:hypothetical protein